MFQYDLTELKGIKCITATGRIDALSAPDIQKVFEGLIMAGDHLIFVDMASVDYLSSAGLRVILAAQKQLKKVGGEIVLFGMVSQVFELFRMSGLTTIFSIATGKDEALHLVERRQASKAVTLEIIRGVRIECVEGPKEKGDFFTIGSSHKTAGSAYREEDVAAVKANRMQFGCGLATLGAKYEDYKNLFGESMTVRGSFFFYPAMKHPSVDYLVNAHEDPSMAYRFLHGFGFNGSYRYVLSFESNDHPLELSSLVEGLFAISSASLLGIVIIAESKGLWGMHLRKVPLEEHRPLNGKSIFDAECFSEWVDFPVEPTYANHAVVATGIAARNRDSAGPEVQSLIADGSNCHIHGGIFEKMPLSRDIGGFDRELLRLFNEAQIYRIQHLLDRSKFSSGMVAVIELET